MACPRCYWQNPISCAKRAGRSCCSPAARTRRSPPVTARRLSWLGNDPDVRLLRLPATGVRLLDLGVRDWIMAQRCLGDGSYAIIGPYLAEVWPAGLRTSGMGLGSGVGNLGKIRGPLGLFLIVGASNYVSPKALDAIFPARLSRSRQDGVTMVRRWTT